MRLSSLLSFLSALLLLLAPTMGRAERTTISLNGQWEVEESAGGDRAPARYGHMVAVPGLTNGATPDFPDVDDFRSRELLTNLTVRGLYAQADLDKLAPRRGLTRQTRLHFWYRRSFDAPRRHAAAILKVSKAQFGTTVYLNGKRIGEHWSNFTAGYFDVTQAMRWDGPNKLVIRIGAHPGALPRHVAYGTDFEKNRWTPGIYDDVTLALSDNPVISQIQVAPRIASAAHPVPNILVQTVLRNVSSKPINAALKQQVFERKSGAEGSEAATLTVPLAPGETKTVTQTIAVPKAHLWSPDDPFLYRLHSSTGGDDVTTQFGMREFRFDTPTQRAYLNGRPYFMRGSNIALHRFFEDPQVGALPWTESWVKRLLIDLPKKLHWNAFRFSIGPVPDRWLEIADEHGMLIQNEYAVWTGSPLWTPYKADYDTKQMISEYSEWMRDGWNHPSVVIWDATNESHLPEFAKTIVPAVRGLDLSNRPWENSYNSPPGPDDPVEDHQYLLEAMAGDFDASGKGVPFELSDIERMPGPAVAPFLKTAHARILNEYGWIWINRDGSPTLLTKKLYPKLLGDRDNTENRRAMYAYLVAGKTEFWRAYRQYAGVMHFPFLTSSSPDAFTSDQFIDLPNLILEPHFEKAVEQAFRPLGVYLNFWRPTLVAGAEDEYFVSMVNDHDRAVSGTLTIAFIDAGGKQAEKTAVPFELSALGAQTYAIRIAAPKAPGEYRFEAIAAETSDPADPTISTRNLRIVAAK